MGCASRMFDIVADTLLAENGYSQYLVACANKYSASSYIADSDMDIAMLTGLAFFHRLNSLDYYARGRNK